MLKRVLIFLGLLIIFIQFGFASAPNPSPSCKIIGTIKSVEFIEAYNDTCLLTTPHTCPTDYDPVHPSKYYVNISIESASYLSGDQSSLHCEDQLKVGSVMRFSILKEKITDTLEINRKIEAAVSPVLLLSISEYVLIYTMEESCNELYWFDNTPQDNCKKKHFCGTYMYQGLQTFDDYGKCVDALNAKNGVRACPANYLPVCCAVANQYSIRSNSCMCNGDVVDNSFCNGPINISVSCSIDSDCILTDPIAVSQCPPCGVNWQIDYANISIQAVNKNLINACEHIPKTPGKGCAAGSPQPKNYYNYSAKCIENICIKVDVNSLQNSICGDGNCDEGEANIQGGCGPNADPSCSGPPSRIGSCPQDCKKLDDNFTPGTGKTKLLPEEASARARERLGELNFTVSVKDGLSRINQTIYITRADKEYKLFGFIKKTVRVDAEIDAESGEVLSIHQPWWSFIATS